MGNRMIIGERTQELKVGYPINVNQNDVRRFTAYAGDEPLKSIELGDLLILGGVTKVYKSARNEANGVITAESQIVGIALSTNVKLNTFFPVGASTSGTVVAYNGGDDGNNLIKGEIPVEYVGAEPAENDPVYVITVTTVSGIDARRGKLTKTAALDGDTTILLSKLKWSGISETVSAVTLSVVRIDLQ